jgi:putative oxidoreductase
MRFDHPALLLLGRLLIVYIFATSGIAKIFGWSGNVAYMNTRHLPLVPVLLAGAIVIEVGGSICLITGFYARTAAFVMFVYMIFVTVIFHAYWSAPQNLAPMQETHFRKNLAIMGGLLFVAAHGPGRWAIQRDWAGGSTPTTESRSQGETSGDLVI